MHQKVAEDELSATFVLMTRLKTNSLWTGRCSSLAILMMSTIIFYEYRDFLQESFSSKTLDLESTPGVRLLTEVKYENRRGQ